MRKQTQFTMQRPARQLALSLICAGAALGMLALPGRTVELDFSGATRQGQPGDPGGLRFVGIADAPDGSLLDLVLTATSPYQPGNFAPIRGEFYRLNLQSGTATDFQLSLVETATDTVVAPDLLTFAFLDLDGSSSAPPFEAIAATTPDLFQAGSELAVASGPNQTTFTGTFSADGGNDPFTLPLSPVQEAVAVRLLYEDTGVFNFTFDAGGNPGEVARSVFLAGEIAFAPSSPPETPQEGVVPFELESSLGLLAIATLFGGRYLWRARRQ